MKILAVTDKEGRIQHSRMILLKKYVPDMDVVTISDKPDFKKYDILYYSNFALRDRLKPNISMPCYASVTSHKCLLDKKTTISKLSKFDKISVNNTFLLDEFRGSIKKLSYTPNGVDTEFFSFIDKPLGRPPVLGWVGNRDRAIKNFETIVKPLSKSCGQSVTMKLVASSKRDKKEQLKNQKEMRDFYHSLDFLLVSSSAEGTPNPALEAMSCGVPLLSTKVGNVIEIVEEGANGWFIKPSFRSATKGLKKLRISDSDYHLMRKETRKRIRDWDWNNKSRAWVDFLTK